MSQSEAKESVPGYDKYGTKCRSSSGAWSGSFFIHFYFDFPFLRLLVFTDIFLKSLLCRGNLFHLYAELELVMLMLGHIDLVNKYGCLAIRLANTILSTCNCRGFGNQQYKVDNYCRIA